MNILTDLKNTVTLMTPFEINVPFPYAELVHAELLRAGVAVEHPQRGDDMLLQFTTGKKVILHVQQ